MNRKISILIVDDEASVRDSLKDWFITDGYEVDCAENVKKALSMLEPRNYDIVLADIKMPGMDGLEMLSRIKDINKETIVIMMTAFATVDTAVKALKDGAFDYVTKPFDPDDLSHLIRNASRQIALAEENEDLKKKMVSLDNVEDIIGDSGAMKKVLGEVESVALTESQLESELFGHEEGAFTGALYHRKGRFEMADNGTIFLDEIATISAKMQVELLRVLETKKFMRVGGNKEITSDFRVICATNKDLKGMVENGTFREDLYYRLNVVNIHIPPLRERPEDIPLLVDYFIRKYCTSMNRPPVTIDPPALRRLEEYPFQGNIRELAGFVYAIIGL